MMPHPFDPVRRWHALAGMCQQFGFKTVVEVGCKEGRTTGFLLAQCPDIHVVAIDPWRAFPAHKGRAGGETYGKWDFAKIEAEFWANVGEHRDRLTFFRNTSLDAAAIAETQGLEPDLVFIDAAHDYENVVADIGAWWPKVRPGGVLAGHDYQHKFPSVMRAVADSFWLWDVGCAPDSVWFVFKREDVPMREAANAA